ncbi:MAG: HigA family addiction module antitoxin [Treponema sp.]|nr:HigA family addiction module antitoxin [Treponema sp.]
MPNTKQSPGAVLTKLLEKNGLNYNRLAKAVGLSSAMVRLIALDQNPVSAAVAFRLAKFFKTKPEYWLALQLKFDVFMAAQDKKLTKELKGIVTVDKATFERKSKAKKAAKTVKKAKTAKAKKAAKPKKVAAKKTAAKKPAAKKATAKKAAAKKPAAKKATVKKAAVKKAAAKKPAAKKPAVKKAVVKKAVVTKAPEAAVKPDTTVKPAVNTEQTESKAWLAEYQPVITSPQPVFEPESDLDEPFI